MGRGVFTPAVAIEVGVFRFHARIVGDEFVNRHGDESISNYRVESEKEDVAGEDQPV